MSAQEDFDVRIWLRRADDFLEAVSVLMDHESSDENVDPNSGPVWVLLAYAFELVLKSERLIACNSFDQVHDLGKLWRASQPTLGDAVVKLTTSYINDARAQLSHEYYEDFLAIQPQYGHPCGSFEENLGQLSRVTAKPFQARYPLEAMIEGIETRYLLFVARGLVRQLRTSVF